MGTVMNDPVADIVADVVATTRRGSLMYSRNRFHAPWGAAFPAGNLANFHVITTGACWLTAGGADPVQLTRGDVVLIPSGAAHELADTPGRPARPMPEIAGRTLDDGAPPSDVVIEGDGPATVWICGGYRLAAGVRHPLTSVLPDVVVITAAEARGTGLGAAVDLIAAEAGGTGPGAPAVMASLVDLLLVYLLRTWFAGRHDNAWGRALSDPTVGTALSLIHTDPGRAWTLDTLARATRTPRATLTRRFAALTGQPPIAYLTAWRMCLAARRLRDGDATVRQIAHEAAGYPADDLLAASAGPAPRAVALLPVSAPIAIVTRPKSMPIRKVAETDAMTVTVTSSWKDHPVITSTATVTASRAACGRRGGLLRHDGGPADREHREQAQRAVLILARQAGRAVADGQSRPRRAAG